MPHDIQNSVDRELHLNLLSTMMVNCLHQFSTDTTAMPLRTDAHNIDFCGEYIVDLERQETYHVLVNKTPKHG